MNLHENNAFGELGGAIGKGLIAGLAATAAITLSQMIEMRITKRQPSEAPLKVAERAAGLKPANKDNEQKLSQEIHWSYGTVWGITRGLISLTGLRGVPATLIHFGAIWGTAMVMLPKFKAAPPVYKEDAKAIVIDGFHHAVYAITAGIIYDTLDGAGKHDRRLNRLIDKLHVKGFISKLKF